MPPFLRLSILPIIGCALLLSSVIWSQRELKLRFLGQAADGQIIGMVLQRTQTADILSGIDTAFVLTLANGDRIQADYVNYTLSTSSILPAGTITIGEAATLDAQNSQTELGDSASTVTLSDNLQVILDVIVRGNAELVRWALLRESRRAPDPTRIVRIEKTEVVDAYLDVPRVPEVFELQNDKLLLEAHEVISPYAGEVRIHAVFDVTDPEIVKSKRGDSLIEYSYARNGTNITPERKDFFLSAEPYSTQFRPIFAYQANDMAVARLSHIGRHGGPTLALRLYGPCRVYYDKADPEQAFVSAVAGPVGKDPLEWFGRYCEGLFGQWGSTALIALAGLLFILTGLFFISLAVFPPRKITMQLQDGV